LEFIPFKKLILKIDFYIIITYKVLHLKKPKMSAVQSNIGDGSVDSSVASNTNSVVSPDCYQRTNKRRRCCASTVSGKKCKMFSLKEDSFENKKYCTHHDKINKISDSEAINNTIKCFDLIKNTILFVYYMICLSIIYTSFNPYPIVMVNFFEPNLFNTKFLRNNDSYIEIFESSSYIYLYEFNLQMPIINPFSFERLRSDFQYFNQTF
jgi:hypothetical protein